MCVRLALLMNELGHVLNCHSRIFSIFYFRSNLISISDSLNSLFSVPKYKYGSNFDNCSKTVRMKGRIGDETPVLLVRLPCYLIRN